ncbi:flagellin B [Dissulfurirhabdus thermomarina]|uniref:Flagellin n=1 Tax=Dissulfurirhabdus thermomarina TaxID=1765737 RepID=A0A6N9TQ48_DISTH|nr:flagellin [Dissulfurirhabdus thermomarina]NDY42570.1 flagellin B [Dissulfurirhabdus thermomarina]NMX23179.1 flagellin B [Dissulfurirhabdus thermomarina]
MSLRINTNISAIDAHRQLVNTNNSLNKSLRRLSSGLRINGAADDASGMAIADSLKSQALGIAQAIRNANDGIAVVQTADGALEEYINIVNTIRTKAIQAASDLQSSDSRQAIQNDISRLLQEADAIAKTTAFNGRKLLDGSFAGKALHIGAYAYEITSFSIQSATVDNIGLFATTQGSAVTGGSTSVSGLTITVKEGNQDVTYTVGASAEDSTPGVNTTAHSAGSAWAIAQAINSLSAKTGVEATAFTELDNISVSAGTVSGLQINGWTVATVQTQAGDADSALRNAINALSDKTNVIAEFDDDNPGKLRLVSLDGSDIVIGTDTGGNITASGLSNGTTGGKITLSGDQNFTLGSASSYGFADAQVTLDFDKTSLSAIDVTNTLRDANGNFYHASERDAAEWAIKIADAALKQLDAIRGDIGSVQNQLEATVRNLGVTRVNVQAAESQIRDVDFAEESSTFAKFQILAQSGTFALAQANVTAQTVLQLLQ